MSRNVLGIIGGAAALLALVILFSAYEVQQEKFPEWLFASAVIVGVLLLVGGSLAWSTAYIILPVREFFGSRNFRWPTVRKDTPVPNQWILDIAKGDAEHPQKFLLILDTEITGLDVGPELSAPYIDLGVVLFNCNLHAVTLGDVSGRAKFHNLELGEPITGLGGTTTVPRGTRYSYSMRQYVSPEQAAQIAEERTEETESAGAHRKELRSFSLSGVRLEVECEGHVTEFYFTDAQVFHYE